MTIGRAKVLLGLAIALVVALIAWAIVLAALMQSTSPKGPGLPGGPAVQFTQPTVNYSGRWVWYNFTVTNVEGNVTWNQTRILLVPGPFGAPDNNTTLAVFGSNGILSAGFARSDSNWTTTSGSPITDGQVIVLKVDSPQTLAQLSVVVSTPAVGGWGQTLP